MTDELQTSGITLDSIETEEAATTEEGGAELATATGENQAKNEDSAQDNVQKAINKQHAKYREEERKRIAAEREAQELKERLDAIEAEKREVTVPEMPDPYDDDYETKAAAREDAIRRQAEQEAQKKLILEQQNAQKEAADRAEQERILGLATEYDNRIDTLGLDRAKLAAAAKTVMDYGLSDELAEFILDIEDGPLITQYLADNLLELDELRHMTPINAALRISTTVREAASTLKPQASSAPDPTETLSGRGAPDQVSSLIKGATFE
jgi:hypothetical protein